MTCRTRERDPLGRRPRRRGGWVDLKIHENGLAAVVELSGDLDGSVTLPPEEEARLHALFRPGCRLTVDVSKVRRLSPVGVRLLLLLYRKGTALGSLSFTRAPQ